jgi:RNA recognition motif-containing protein
MKLYVGNLSYDTTDQSLADLFASAGTVESAAVITDRDTGRSRGFGFVEMSSRSEGDAAIRDFNDKEIDGRTLVVNESRPREARGSNFGGGNRRSY